MSPCFQLGIPCGLSLCIFFLLFGTFASKIEDTKWILDNDFEKNLDTSLALWTMEGVSLITCGTLCNQNSSCRSFVYHSSLRKCLISSSYKRGLPAGEGIQPGWKYYTQPTRCDGGYVFNHHLGLCFKIHSEPKNFDNAMSECEAEGAKLIIIQKQDEFQYIQREVKGIAGTLGIGPFIGLRAVEAKREWKWWNDQAASYLFWADGEPNDDDSEEKCVHLYALKDFMYNDVSCMVELTFICQIYI